MDKKTFISKLEQSLSVLQEDELKDIISEYEQHIDMKQERGLTEEEPIADFGSLDELTGEILEAYHVRADYAIVQKRGQKNIGRKKDTRHTALQIQQKCVKTSALISDKIKYTGRRLGELLLIVGQFLKKPVTWLQKLQNKRSSLKDEEEYTKIDQKENLQTVKPTDTRTAKLSAKERHNTMEKMIHGTMRFFGRTINFFIHSFLWGIQMAWNGFCVGTALILGGFGLFSLFCLGVLTVLLVQHYPLMGVTLGCLGLVLCSFSAAGLFASFIRRKNETSEYTKETWKKREKRENETDSDKEICFHHNMEVEQNG